MKRKPYVSPAIKEYGISPRDAILGFSLYPVGDIEPMPIEEEGEIYSVPMF